jgi:hypothetical protein
MKQAYVSQIGNWSQLAFHSWEASLPGKREGMAIPLRIVTWVLRLRHVYSSINALV